MELLVLVLFLGTLIAASPRDGTKSLSGTKSLDKRIPDALDPPSCIPGLGGPTFRDCGIAYRAMEIDTDQLGTVYFGTWGGESDAFTYIASHFDPPLQDPSRFHYLSTPRIWAYGTCVIALWEIQNRLDIATKDAIKRTALQILTQCVAHKKTGGLNNAGEQRRLQVSITAFDEMLPVGQARILAARMQLRSDCVVLSGLADAQSPKFSGEIASCSNDSPSGQDIPGSSGFKNVNNEAPPEPVLCVDSRACGMGSACQPEVFVGTDISWGLPQSKFYPDRAGYCISVSS
ncbi:MAG: hypothetical protein M1827_005166 [Pycnora praestabilis]|nr:MAG: hypothetical protein M1827_005166 [Pycnora praestabilis]